MLCVNALAALQEGKLKKDLGKGAKKRKKRRGKEARAQRGMVDVDWTPRLRRSLLWLDE